MSSEISYQSQMKLANGALSDSYSASGLKATQSAAFLVRNVQTVSNVYVPLTSVLDLGSVAAPGWSMFTNLDATNYVEIGIDVGGTFYPFVKMLPGEQAGPFRVGVSAVYARANTAPVDLFYVVYNA